MRPISPSPSHPAVIKRVGAVLEASIDGKQPLPMTAVGPLLDGFTYEHTTHLRGYEAKRAGRKVEVESRRLYAFDKRGRLLVPSGFADLLYKGLKARGYAVDYVDLTGDGGRPDALTPDWDLVQKHFTFREKQEGIVRKISRRIERRLGGVVQLPPGSGKSYLFAAYALLYRNARIAFSAPDVDNTLKTAAHLSKYIPNVGVVGAGKNQVRRVTVYTLGSLHKCDDVDLLFCDEVHSYVAERASSVLGTVAPRALRYGFSATPEGRADGADAKIEALFGPVVTQVTWGEAISLGWVTPIEVRWVSVRMPDGVNPAAGFEDTLKKRYGLWRNEHRNQVIADQARQFGDDEQVLIMVETFDHAMHLKKLLPEFEVCYAGVDEARVEALRGLEVIPDDFEPIDGARRTEMRLAFEAGTLKKVIATDVWSTGVSFNGLAALIRGDARRSTIKDEQIPGRVSRIDAGKSVGVVVDLLDEFDDGFAQAARLRSKNYREKGWVQKRPGMEAA